jgi:hypothetical protein
VSIMFNFTPLSGAQSDSSASQSLLELDGGVKVLIDVGWDESFDVEKLRNLEKYVPPSCKFMTSSYYIVAYNHWSNLGCVLSQMMFTRYAPSWRATFQLLDYDVF